MDLDARGPPALRSSALERATARCHRERQMATDDDPLARLAAELERLSQAQLALGEATAALIAQAPPQERRGLASAAATSRAAARTASEASAKALASSDA